MKSPDKWEAEKAGPADANERAMRLSNPSSVRETSAIEVEFSGWRIDQTETTGRGHGTRAALSSADEGKRSGSAAACEVDARQKNRQVRNSKLLFPGLFIFRYPVKNAPRSV